jgi:hypothetical protein
MKKPVEDKCRWLVEHNRNLFVRDVDWKKCFLDIQTSPGAFWRYYPLVQMDVNHRGWDSVCTALFVNDDLFAYGGKGI